MLKISNPSFSPTMGGSGLGLYLAKIILENMNGVFKIENIEDGVKYSLTVTKESKEMKPKRIHVLQDGS